jgi:hypothetical protein
MSAWPWPSSDSTATIVPAFVAALQAMEHVTKDRKADLGEKGAKYKYADLTSVIEVAKPTLEANGLAVTQVASDDGVQTIVVHRDGEWLSFPPLTIKTGQNTPQAQGSAITYAKRYQLLGVLGIATEDDDGQAAAKPADPLVSAPMLKTLGIQLRKLVGDDREAGLAFIADAAGRQVASSKELTTKEAAAVLNALRDAVPQDEAA